jgi:hypothetical protein
MRLRAAFRLDRQSAEAFALRVSVVAAGLGTMMIVSAGMSRLLLNIAKRSLPT